eukprot:scaffold595919_cov32-Prasinocladus_malaysianus.AAC.1
MQFSWQSITSPMFCQEGHKCDACPKPITFFIAGQTHAMQYNASDSSLRAGNVIRSMFCDFSDRKQHTWPLMALGRRCRYTRPWEAGGTSGCSLSCPANDLAAILCRNQLQQTARQHA